MRRLIVTTLVTAAMAASFLAGHAGATDRRWSKLTIRVIGYPCASGILVPFGQPSDVPRYVCQ